MDTENTGSIFLKIPGLLGGDEFLIEFYDDGGNPIGFISANERGSIVLNGRTSSNMMAKSLIPIPDGKEYETSWINSPIRSGSILERPKIL